ncbi:MAG: hypothetical protein AAGN35_20115 [Bacteroidota bacterium]
MESSNDLFDLIKSLSPSEKRSIRLHTENNRRNDASHYQEIFACIEEMEHWDAGRLQSQVGSIANLPAAMYQLKQLIYRILSQRSRRTNPIHQLRDIINHIDIAYEKGLFRQYLKLIDKAEKLARKYENYPILLELMRHRRQGMFLRLDRKTDIEELRNTEQEVLRQIALDSAYVALNNRLQDRLRVKARFRTKKERAELTGYLSEDLIQSGPQGDSFESRLAYYEVSASIAVALSDWQAAVQHYRRIIALWQEYPFFAETRQSQYTQSLSKVIGMYLFLYDAKGYRKALDQLSQLKLKSKAAQKKQEGRAHYYELLYYMNFGGYDAGKAHIEEYEHWIRENQNHLSRERELNIYHNFTVFFFLHGQCELAWSRLRHIIDYPYTVNRRDIIEFARIFEWVLLKELDAPAEADFQDLLLGRTRSLQRFLRNKKGDLNALERVVKDHLIGGDPQKDMTHQPELLAIARQELEEIMHSEQPSRPPIGGQELLFWLEARQKGIPLGTLFQEQLAMRLQSEVTQ